MRSVGSNPQKNGLTSSPTSSIQKVVARSSFSFLFSEICTRAYSFPVKVRNMDEVEQRLTRLGEHVGSRMTLLFSIQEGNVDTASLSRRGNGAALSRPFTVEGALRFLTVQLWQHWFGKQADDLQRESSSDRFFLVDSFPMVLEFVDPSPDYMDADGGWWKVNYASFIGGMAKGALVALGFDCEVLTYHQPEPGKPHQSLFVISFSKQVWDRERM